ncbi:MAG: hypothetical protein ACE5K4_09770 [Candidatus Hydrothermarchaeota archaeon]
MLKIDAKGLHYKDLNERIWKALESGERELELINVNGQRYIADGVGVHCKIDINGTPGDDLAAFMDGPEITVYGDVQDGTGNTMNSGKVIIHGDARDITGHSMRGGCILVKGNVGQRVGIHMKQYGNRFPVIIAGGTAGDFLGEYMAGGVVVILNLKEKDDVVGDWIGTGIHGGVIYIRATVEEDYLGVGAVFGEFGDSDRKLLKPYLREFSSNFHCNFDKIIEDELVKIVPRSHRPFGDMYIDEG